MHFFKILDTYSNKHKRLELPREFTDNYGTELSDLAILKVLNSIWHIRLKKAKGLLLFENGWPEFMDFYSICVGHVLLFRYDGNSKFQVHRVPAVFAASHLRNITETMITPMVSDGRTWNVRYVSRSPTDKRLSHGWCKFVADNDLKEGNVCVFELIDRKKIEMIVHIFRQHKPFSRKLPPKSSNYTAEFQATLEEAEKFTSENPFFKVVIQDAHIKAGTVRVPADFATSHLTNITRMVITLRVSDERTWDVGYVSQTPMERRISQGWREFVADNDLKEGDVCVFELVDNRENFEMNVHIFRLEQDGID
ncbi:B3 domain-containing transcription factor VRN1-like [Papaver somniferum]|uniref:B3 domain-containing transcription factor VRN1-like n=1 Tax=Papaver somniferum TaxID=3469 RepID=UPI000E702AA0|nr:B3 domain-containing transcription factor VRN1-like [Papaver somniferum]